MRVPARIFANETLLEDIQNDKTLEQLRNVACMPGVVAPALCMPDGHQGYGFPVGGVAAFDAEDGYISPGAVGFDINCIAGDSEVRLPFGRTKPIREFLDDFEGSEAVVPATDDEYDSEVRLATETRSRTVHEIRTAVGDRLESTADHEFRTPDGMRPLRDLEPGDQVFVSPFEGLSDKRPPEFVVLDESDFEDEDPQLVSVLKERDILPLKSTDKAFNHLLKLVGFHTGDGAFNRERSWFYGDPEDLETIRDDIEAVGFKPSKIYEREREHEVRGNSFERTEYSTRSTSNAFKQLLIRLGAPDGRKTDSSFTVPDYLDRLADWQKALYLSAFFGAEMSAPDSVARTNLYAPAVSHNRLVKHEQAGEQFMRDLMRHLNDLGIKTNNLEVVERGESTAGETVRFRFGIKTAERNLIRFFTTVGYRYNREKRRRAALAATYLKRKETAVQRRARIASEARAMADGGTSTSEVKAAFDEVNERFIERSLYDQRDGRPRPPADFPGFEEFCESTPVRNDFTVPVEIADITEQGEKTVYDIGVTHDAHAFVANGFVVSNCGVRMVKTNLTYEDIRGREEELVDALFDAVPCGLGGGGVHDVSHTDLEAALERGVDWCVEEGYAVRDDLRHCEDEGRRPDADLSAVSKKAKDRGANQMGSLGSGNHFLEVQRVTDIYDDDTADAFGLDENQVVVLIHCGSRGLGHQVCSDYLRRIEQEYPDFTDDLPDKDLAAAPAGSELADDYYGAMCAAINFAWVNRQLITHAVRETFADVFDTSWEALEMDLLYDVAHNIAKKESHDVYVEPEARRLGGGEAADPDTEDGYSLDGDGGRVERDLYVHRKGATRAFPAGHPEVPKAYRNVGQPIIIPGSMGAGSYILKGGDKSMTRSFGSTAHGAGRLMSRTQAKREYGGGEVQADLHEQNEIHVKAASGETIAEEAPGVYKDVDEVVGVSDALDIGDLVVRTFPIANIKG
ncbi:RtcB family protein [Halobacterium noricense]|nr:RtcB family protein [Halobacterium noricense]